MKKTWLRKWRVLVSADGEGETGALLDVSDLRCVFRVRYLPDKPATCSVQVYNFNRATEKLALKGYRLIIFAGYREGSNYGQIFDGKILQSFVNRNGQDYIWEAVAVAGDYLSQFVMGSIGAGGTQREQLEQISEQAEAQLDSISQKVGDSEKLARGKVFFGSAGDYISNIAYESDSFFKIDEKGELSIINLDDEIPENQAIVLNQTNGLIGSPTYSDEGMQISMLLDSRVRLGGLIKINNSDAKRNPADFSGGYQTSQRLAFDVDGEYRAASVLHEGDTHGDSWKTTIIGYSQSKSLVMIGNGVAR